MSDENLFALYEGTYQFWSEHHSGQFSRGYAILCRALRNFNPGLMHDGWESMDEESRDVYRSWCEKERETCEYDCLEYIVREEYPRGESDLVDYFLDHYGDETPQDSGLQNYERSDFVNLNMCYTRDLIRFYEQNETELEDKLNDLISDYGCTSLLEFMAGETIESVSDLQTAIVNRVMSDIGLRMWEAANDA